MKATTEKHPIEYSILDISTIQFATLVISTEPAVKIEQLRLNTSFSYGVDISRNLFTCKLDILAYNGESPLFKIETQASYRLSQESIDHYINGNIFSMPVSDVSHFTSILYGATRGILVCKLEDTSIRHFVLPPIGLKEIITRPLNIELSGRL